MVKLINRIFEIKGDSRRVRSLSQDLANGSKFIMQNLIENFSYFLVFVQLSF